MESAIRREVLEEGAAIHRGIRQWEARFRSAMLDGAWPHDRAAPPLGPRQPETRAPRSPLHAYYPMLFRTLFPSVAWRDLRELCRLGRLYAEHLLAVDAVLDQGQRVDPLELFVSQLKQLESLRGLHRLFGSVHPFWSALREASFHAWRAVLLERLRHGHRLLAYSGEEFEQIAKGKTALFKVFPLALARLGGRADLESALSLSLDCHHVGLLLLDDLEDWKEDAAALRFSYPLTRVILEHGLADEFAKGARPSLAAIGDLLYGSGIAGEQLAAAGACFRNAMESVARMELPLWLAFNRDYRVRCTAMAREVEGYARGRAGSRRRAERADEDRAAHAPEESAVPEVVVQTGVPESRAEVCRVVLREACAALPHPGGLLFCLGSWPGMGAHFWLSQDRCRLVGIQLDPADGFLSTVSGRPLETEVTLAYVATVRCLLQGESHLSEPEKLLVAGIAVRLRLQSVPAQDLWDVAGMSLLDWQWCQKNEWLLWACAARNGCGCAGPVSGAGDLPAAEPLAAGPGPVPRNAGLYLGLRAVEEIAGKALKRSPADFIAGWSRAEIAKSLRLPPC
ncbi:MAG: hypothetical protein AB1640_04210 [bacterium]